MLRIHVPADQVDAIRDRVTIRIESARQQLVHDGTLSLASEIAATVPIRTGQTQQAWEAEAQRITTAQPQDVGQVSAMSTRVDVKQMQYLEYGTSRMAPRAPARRALEALARRVLTFFRWGG